ncbi:hypothetical protein [Streptomyces sp. NPDC058623]|uniref:hypothetical protein n=1 Tax=Streptomyces sp. NPDC058623 TaxID=3346563 RepID=UPI003668D697
MPVDKGPKGAAVERWSAGQIAAAYEQGQRETWAREDRKREAREREVDRVDSLDPFTFLDSRLAPGKVRTTFPRQPQQAQPLTSDLLEAMEVRPCVVCGADAGEACEPVAGTSRRSGLTHLARLRQLRPEEDSLTVIRAKLVEALHLEEYKVWALGERCWCGADPDAVCGPVKGTNRVGSVHPDRLLSPHTRIRLTHDTPPEKPSIRPLGRPW